MSLGINIVMQDDTLSRFGSLLKSLKEQKAAESEEGDERSERFNEGFDQGDNNVANAMM